MKKYNNFELLLHAAAESYAEKEAKEFLELDTTHIDNQIRMRKRVKKLINRARHNYRLKWYKVLAIACLIALILATTACLSISELREQVYNAFTRFFEQYVAIDFEEGDINQRPLKESDTETETVTESETLPPTPLVKIEQKAYASYLPEPYTCMVEADDDLYYFLSYYDLQGNWKFTFSQELVYDAPHFNDIEGQQSEIVYIHGNQGVLLKDCSNPGFYTLVWRDTYYTYSIYGTFSSIETLKKVADGIVLNEAD